MHRNHRNVGTKTAAPSSADLGWKEDASRSTCIGQEQSGSHFLAPVTWHSLGCLHLRCNDHAPSGAGRPLGGAWGPELRGEFLDIIDASVPKDLDIHIILDNYGTHKTPSIHRWLLKHPRFTLHFTPTSASWINMVERWFGKLTDKQIRRGVHRSTAELEAAIMAYLEVTNEHPKPFVWTKSADQILAAVARFCLHTSNSGH